MLNTERLCVGCMNDNGGEKVCSICGYDSAVQNHENFLPTNHWLKNRYLVGRVIDSNGEGVTYIGWDNNEDQIVNIREYFPDSAALRLEDKSVAIAKGNEFVFNEGIMNFLELHKKISELKPLPALPQFIEVFEDNGTAYSITKSSSGITLREFLIRNGGSLSWEQARPLFLPVLTTLQALHSAGILHRGISPETIIVGRDGKLRLSGICVRDVRMSKSSLTVQLYPGFSATEQYGFDLELVDGRYTDVYSIAATLFRVLMGAAPTEASERISNDNLQIPAKYIETLPKYVLTALANALQIMPQNRIQDMEAFRLALTPVSTEVKKPAPKPKTQVSAAPQKPKVAAPVKKAEPPKNNSAKKYAIISSAVTAVVFIVLAFLFVTFFNGPAKTPETNNEQPQNNNSVVVQKPEDTPEPTPSTPAVGEKLYAVPDFVYNAKNSELSVSYAQIIKDINYSSVYEFEFEVVEKQFSDKVPRGYVISQTPEANKTVKKGSKIKFTLSLGPRNAAIADVSGMTKDQAILELMKQGFSYENILFEEPYDINAKPNAVIRTEPAANTKVDTDTAVTVYFNRYSGEEIPNVPQNNTPTEDTEGDETVENQTQGEVTGSDIENDIIE